VTVNAKLVICIGNAARGDDGAAHEVARLLRCREQPPHTDLITAPALDVSMAEDIAAARLLIIVDAERRESPPVRVSELSPAADSSPSGHSIDASGLLALSDALYGAPPRALLVTVAAPDMAHGTTLSETARAAAHEATERVLGLITGRDTV
jgi:hydrogenase maturation protease